MRPFVKKGIAINTQYNYFFICLFNRVCATNKNSMTERRQCCSVVQREMKVFLRTFRFLHASFGQAVRAFLVLHGFSTKPTAFFVFPMTCARVRVQSFSAKTKKLLCQPVKERVTTRSSMFLFLWSLLQNIQGRFSKRILF